MIKLKNDPFIKNLKRENDEILTDVNEINQALYEFYN